MEDVVQTTTGIIGISTFALTMISIPLYFIYSGPPPAKNILLRILITMLLCTGLIAFMVGFRQIVIQTDAAYDWLATLCLSFGLAYVILVFVAAAIEAGAVLGREKRIDPTVIGSGGEGSLLIYGPIQRLMAASFLVVAGIIIRGAGMLPDWTGWIAFCIAFIQLLFIPTMFYKTEPSVFYSINGWNIPILGGLFLTWILIVSILFLTG